MVPFVPLWFLTLRLEHVFVLISLMPLMACFSGFLAVTVVGMLSYGFVAEWSLEFWMVLDCIWA